ncbi:type II and III secretion system protein family protein [Acidocella sp.]|uniref:type II and III secretion system protein family protein n=1 Tax=Acidocella sp. TaxID=50710 RepID=UPI0026233ED9|nr:type II and III secretion system protein family protein [Acidocella sp.]
MRKNPLSLMNCGALALVGAFAVAGTPALAQSAPPDGSGAGAASQPAPPAYYGSISVTKSEGKLVKLPRPVANLFVADDSIVSVRPASPTTMFVFGKTPGNTNIVATDQEGNRVAQFSVQVTPSNYTAQRIEQAAPGGDVSVNTSQNGVTLNGTVSSPEQADQLYNQAKAEAQGGNVTNNLTVTEPVQVELKVRIASMSRTVTRELGINWSAVDAHIGSWMISASSASLPQSLASESLGGVAVQNPSGTFQGVIDALATDNLAHILAEPTLTALSGTQASFEVGGQFPIPVSSGSNGSITVTYKNYGVLLTFTPTVYSDGRIALQVSPEVSSLNSANSAQLSSSGSNATFNVPSLNVTAATTTVILGSGQGMAIAGLLEDTTNQVDNGVPGLSEVPLVGALFRGDAFQREQQELVITVTPYLVTPANNPNSIASPDDGWSPPNDLQRILLLRDNGTVANNSQIPGDAGFMVQ